MKYFIIVITGGLVSVLFLGLIHCATQPIPNCLTSLQVEVTVQHQIGINYWITLPEGEHIVVPENMLTEKCYE